MTAAGDPDPPPTPTDPFANLMRSGRNVSVPGIQPSNPPTGAWTPPQGLGPPESPGRSVVPAILAVIVCAALVAVVLIILTQ